MERKHLVTPKNDLVLVYLTDNDSSEKKEQLSRLAQEAPELDARGFSTSMLANREGGRSRVWW